MLMNEPLQEKSMNMSLRSSKQMRFLRGLVQGGEPPMGPGGFEKLLCLGRTPGLGQHPGQGPGPH